MSRAAVIWSCLFWALFLAAPVVPACHFVRAQPVAEKPAPKDQTPREKARERFAGSVKVWAWSIQGLLVLAGVATLLIAFTRFGPLLGLEWHEGATVIALSAMVSLLQYGLEAWGAIAVDILAWATLAATLVTAAWWSYRFIRKWRRTA